MKHYSILFQFIVLMALSGCTYLYEAGKQAQYAAQLNNEPKLRTYKHLVTTGKFFVYGKILGDAAINTTSMAVVAMSDRFQRNEIVDINNFSRIDSYYGLNLPEGTYRLLAVKDLDGNGFFEESEVIGCRMLSLSEKETPGKVKGGFDMVAGSPGVCSALGEVFCPSLRTFFQRPGVGQGNPGRSCPGPFRAGLPGRGPADEPGRDGLDQVHRGARGATVTTTPCGRKPVKG